MKISFRTCGCVAGCGVLCLSPWFCIGQPLELESVPTGACEGYCSGVIPDGDFAYTGGTGMRAFYVADPAKPVCRSTNGPVYPVFTRVAFARTGTKVLYGRNPLDVWDTTDPTNCVKLGSYTQNVFCAVAERPYAYLGTQTNGIEILAITNPANCALVATYRDSEATAIMAICHKAAVLFANVSVLGQYSFRVISVADPANPVLLGSAPMSTSAWAVKAVGQYAYIAATTGFFIFDISNLSSPIQVGTYNWGTCRDVAINEGYAFLSTLTNGVIVVDVSEPSNCVIVTRLLSGPAYGIAWQSDRLFVGNSARFRVISSISQVQHALRVTSGGGLPFILEAAPSISDGVEWTPLLTTNLPTLPFYYVDCDVNGAGREQKFYRLRRD